MLINLFYLQYVFLYARNYLVFSANVNYVSTISFLTPSEQGKKVYKLFIGL